MQLADPPAADSGGADALGHGVAERDQRAVATATAAHPTLAATKAVVGNALLGELAWPDPGPLATATGADLDCGPG